MSASDISIAVDAARDAAHRQVADADSAYAAKLDRVTAQEARRAVRDAGPDSFPGERVPHEDDLSVEPRDAVAPVGDGPDLDDRQRIVGRRRIGPCLTHAGRRPSA